MDEETDKFRSGFKNRKTDRTHRFRTFQGRNPAPE